MAARPELVERPGDRFLSYALMPYEPLAPPDGKLRSANLLHHSFDALGASPEAEALCTASTAHMGPGGTAWGVKEQAGVVSWELYYYYHWDRQPLTLGRLGRLLDDGPFPRAELPDWDRSWYSLSFDLTLDVLQGDAPIDGYHVYATHSPAEPRTALSYALGPTGLRLENVYYLFHPVDDRAALEGYLASSAFPPGQPPRPDDVLWPELGGGDHIAVAHKPTCEGIYFGGIDVRALLAFLRRTSFAPWMTAHVEAERERYDHLRFDAGFDYRVGADGRVEIVKAGFYGFF